MQNHSPAEKKNSCSNWLQVHRNHFPLHQMWVRLCLSRANSQLPGPLANCNKKRNWCYLQCTHTQFVPTWWCCWWISWWWKEQLNCLHIICCTNDHMSIPWGVSAAINGIKNGKHVQKNAAFDCQNPKPPLRFTPGLSAMLPLSTKYSSSRLPWGNWNQISGWRW